MLQSDHAGDGTDVDDMTRTLPPHDGQRGLHHMHDAVKVRGELLLDFCGRHLLEITEQTVTGVIDQNVNAPETLHRLVDRRFGLRVVDDVQLHKCDVLWGNVGKGVANFLDISAGRDDSVARAQRGLGNSCSESATGTCDKPNFVHGVFR